MYDRDKRDASPFFPVNAIHLFPVKSIHVLHTLYIQCTKKATCKLFEMFINIKFTCGFTFKWKWCSLKTFKPFST